jgi:hypothetical protein
MTRHLEAGGVLVVEPWFEPGTMTHGFVTLLSTDLPDGARGCRMSHTAVEGRLSRLHFEYLIGDAGGLRRETEVHELGLFTRDETMAAMTAAGLRAITHDERGPGGRGLYIATRP